MKEFFCAPLQGFTDRFWREAHADFCRGEGLEPPRYCAPFARVEKGVVRPRDLRDIDGDKVLPQAIFKNLAELQTVADAVTSAGHSCLDLNLGCPFPPQIKAGRGAALVGKPDFMREVSEWMSTRPAMTFSIKMRPGVKEAHEWKEVVDIINSMPLSHVTVHPRTAVQGYKGETDLDTFSDMLSAITHPVIYNGNISTPEEAEEICTRFPRIKGIMIGRGILARPTLYAEYRGKTYDASDRAEAWLDIMRAVSQEIAEVSAGDAQALMRLKPRLEYADEELLGHKFLKSLKKSASLDKFLNILG